MKLSVGIVGLPNAGKSTLFNALVKKQAATTGKHPFTTVEPNKGTVEVPSKRLDRLALMCGAKTKTPVKLAFVDIAGLIKDAHQGEGLGNQFLSYIREVDLILHVVREFADETVAHVAGKIDAERDLEIVRMELILKDIETTEKQLGETRQKPAKIGSLGGHLGGQVGERVLRKIKGGLDEGKLVREMGLSEEEREIIKPLFLLTDKPEVVVLNCGEGAQQPRTRTSSVRGRAGPLQICAKLEEELAGLAWAEQRQYLREFNLPEPALNRVIRECYKKLDLLTFYTIAGGKEARAWAIARGSTAYEAAGKIHTDMQKGFIKVEVINADALLKIGSWSRAREMGKVELHGRDYIVKEHDVVEIKFN